MRFIRFAEGLLLYVQNRLKEAIKEDHLQLSVLFIKLAERLYDLRHATGYIHLTEVQHMAQETLAIDVQLANAYLGPEIGAALEQAAKQALEVCKDVSKDQKKDKNSRPSANLNTHLHTQEPYAFYAIFRSFFELISLGFVTFFLKNLIKICLIATMLNEHILSQKV